MDVCEQSSVKLHADIFKAKNNAAHGLNRGLREKICKIWEKFLENKGNANFNRSTVINSTKAPALDVTENTGFESLIAQ